MLECDVNGEITLGEIVDEVNMKTSVGRNRIINGDFAVWQDTDLVVEEGVSDAYGADLFIGHIDNFTAGKFTYSKSTMGNNTSLKATINTAFAGTGADRWSDVFSFYNEAVNIYDCLGEDITISFKFRSNVTGTFPISFMLVNAGWEAASYVTTFDYNSTGTIQDVEVTIPLPDNSELIYDVTNTPGDPGFGLRIGQIAGSDLETTAETWNYANNWDSITSSCTNWVTSASNYIEMAQLQLEKGSSKTEFEKIDYGTQLARVQRYYVEFNKNSRHNWFYFGTGSCGNTSTGVIELVTKVSMRDIPTFISSGSFVARNNGNNLSSLTLSLDSESNVDHIACKVTTTLTTSHNVTLNANNDLHAYIELDARF